MTETIHTKQCKIVELELKALDESGVFTGYGSIFGNTDAYGDVVTKGAFAEFLANNPASNVKLLWQHNSDEPIGVYEEIYEDDNGLFVRGRLLINEIARAKEAHALLKAKAINGLSIGFTINKDGSHFGADGKRYLNNLGLWEISIVTFPANAKATISDTKKIETIRDFEKFLRESGKFSNSQATFIASHGFIKGLQRDAETIENEQLSKDVLAILNTIKEEVKSI